MLQVPGNLRSNLQCLKNAVLTGCVYPTLRGTEAGSAGVQEVSSCSFSRLVAAEVLVVPRCVIRSHDPSPRCAGLKVDVDEVQEDALHVVDTSTKL